MLRRLVECLSRDRTKHQVAEVTSLGLVQMTRKKLGLGLLESFSEACEVCAGRGVIVHHDPVVKHRPAAAAAAGRAPARPRRPAGAGRGSNGGDGNGSSAAAGTSNGNGHATGVTHAITDDAKNALAQIAASTLARTRSRGEHRRADGAARRGRRVDEPAVTADSGPRQARGRRSRSDANADARRRRAAAKSRAKRGGRAGSTTSPDAAAASRRGTPRRRPPSRASRSPTRPTPVTLLDIPVAATAATSRRAPSKETEQLLDSVLDALPQPKQPGQGRGRSRRVSTAAIAGGSVAPEITREPTPASSEHPSRHALEARDQCLRTRSRALTRSPLARSRTTSSLPLTGSRARRDELVVPPVGHVVVVEVEARGARCRSRPRTRAARRARRRSPDATTTCRGRASGGSISTVIQ